MVTVSLIWIGDIISLIHEYGINKENKLIGKLLRAGHPPQKLAKDLEIPLSRVLDIERTLNSEK